MSLSPSLPAEYSTARYDIAAFVAEVEQIIASEPDRQRIVAAVEERLARLLTTPDLLAPEHRLSDPDHYWSHLVAVAPSGAFSVVALVWLPGQTTPVHDHICWCIVGILEGQECETRFQLMQNVAGERWLLPVGEEVMAPGTTGVLFPPDENIHQVGNVGETVAISIHVYGADLATVATHSSINECFDALPIRHDTNGVAIPWRATQDAGCAEVDHAFD